MLTVEPMRDVIGRALYEEPPLDRNWYDLSEERREPWRQDADRVIESLKVFAYWFGEFAHEESGADWLAATPEELFRDFIDRIIETKGPRPGAWLDVPRDPAQFA